MTPKHVITAVFSLLLFSTVLPESSFANTMPRDPVLSKCAWIAPMTPAITLPAEVNRNNNLRRKTGSGYFAKGEPLHFHGKLVDESCTPVSDAVITLWQADAEGKILPEQDKHFNGSGTAISDNLGQFDFLTVIPGAFDTSEEQSIPHLNIRIQHAHFPEFTSRIFLDPQLLQNTKDDRYPLTAPMRTVEGGKIAYFTFTLMGNTEYRKF